MRISEFMRDHAPTVVLLISVGVGTYTNVAVLGEKLEALTNEFRKSEQLLAEEQERQWDQLMQTNFRLQDNESNCLVLEERVHSLKAEFKEHREGS